MLGTNRRLWLTATEGTQVPKGRANVPSENGLSGQASAALECNVFDVSFRVGMLGYSGGVIVTEWAAELASTYAPDVTARMIGAR
jgi:Secretory lipase